MTDTTIAEQAEHISRRRARLLPLLAVIYLIQQFSFFAAVPANPERLVDWVKISAWVVLSLVLLAALTTKGYWLHARAVRDLIDDESTRAHRVAAHGWGLVMALWSAIALFLVSIFEPISTREAIHVIVSLGLGAAIIRFAMLEWRASRDD